MLASIAACIIRQWGDQPDVVARTQLFLPTRRAEQAFRQAWLHQLPSGRALPLPRLLTLGEPDTRDLFWHPHAQPERASPTPTIIPPLQRRYALAHVMRQLHQQRGEDLPLLQALQRAEHLITLLDEWQREEIPPNALHSIDDMTASRHWQLSRRELSILFEQWPAWLQQHGYIEPVAWRNQQWQYWIEQCQQHPPSTPVILAGSTGSQPVIRRLMQQVLQLPQGLVILPDADTTALTTDVGGTHPQTGLRHLLDTLHQPVAALQPWPVMYQPIPKGRECLLHAMFLPANAGRHWRQLSPEDWSSLSHTLTRLHWLEADDEQEESALIALILRESLAQPDTSVALITPDRALAARVSRQLRYWELDIADSGGNSLLESYAVQLLLAFLQLLTHSRQRAIDWLNLFHHPWLRLSEGRGSRWQWAIEQLDLALRKTRSPQSLHQLRKRASEAGEEVAQSLFPVLDVLEQAWHTVQGHHATTRWQADDWLEAMRQLCHLPPELWQQRLQGETGQAFRQWLEAWDAACQHLAPLTLAQQRDILLAHIGQARFYRHSATHPRLHMLSPQEARMLSFDRVVLAGFNEGVWPSTPTPDPWLSRAMRMQVGLPMPERQIALSAHDIYGFLQAPQVFLTRARKQQGAPQLASRWWQRLHGLLQGHVPAHQGDATAHYRHLWRMLHPALAPVSRPAPAPVPALTDRPNRLSVSDIDLWQTDPYRLYAKHLLRLYTLDGWDNELTAADFGTWVHDLCEAYAQQQVDIRSEQERANWLNSQGTRLLQDWESLPAVQRFWWPRLQKLWPQFEAEHARRKKHLLHLAVEQKGQLTRPWGQGHFTLTARADRLEYTSTGLTIIDYKTGTPPKPTELFSMSKPQLALEALIAAEGHYAQATMPDGSSLPACQPCQVEFWHFGQEDMTTHTYPAQEEYEYSSRPKRSAHLLHEADQRLTELLTLYLDATMPYLASPQSNSRFGPDEWAYFSRRQEWGGV